MGNSAPSTAPCFKCNSCFAAFPGVDMLREHYKSPWYVFNSKRRAHNLPHVGRDQFLGLQKTVLKSTPLPAPTMLVHAAVTQKIPPPTQNPAVKHANRSSSSAAANEENGNDDRDKETVYEDFEEEGGEDDDVDAVEGEDDVDLSPEISLFDNKIFNSTEDCLQYMSTTYGFFIPDSEYLEDMPGLLEYLSEKVRIGNICLYCQKRFRI